MKNEINGCGCGCLIVLAAIFILLVPILWHIVETLLVGAVLTVIASVVLIAYSPLLFFKIMSLGIGALVVVLIIKHCVLVRTTVYK